MAAAINGKPPAVRPLPASPSSLCSYLSSRTNPCASLCLCNTPTRARELQFPRAAASGSRRRRRSVAAGEGLDPPVLFDFWDRQELDKLVVSQVFVPRRPWQPRPELTGAPPEPPPLSSPFAATSSPPVSPPSSSARGEQKPTPNSPLICAQHRLLGLAGVAAPPPYGAGRR
jgi:hypothetical protein